MSEFDNNIDNGEIDFAEIFRKLKAKWKFIAMWSAIGAFAGIVIAFSIPRVYSCSAVLAPERTKSSSSNLGTLASIAGVSLANLGSSDAMTPDVYPTIIKSTPFIVDLFSVPVSFTKDKETLTTDYYTYLKDYTKVPWWGAVFSLPGRAISWVFGLFSKDDEDNTNLVSSSGSDSFYLTKEQYGVCNAIRGSLKIDIDKKTYIITVGALAQDPVVSAQVCNALSDNLKAYLDKYHFDKASEDLNYYENLYTQSQKEYYEAQQAYANYVDANQGIVHRSRYTEQERLQNEMNLKYNLYNACAQQVQQARAKIQMETPTFAIVSPATVPHTPSKPSKITIFAGLILLFGAAACAWVLYKDKLKDFFTTN